MSYRKSISFIILLAFSTFYKAQSKPNYPEPKKGQKLVIVDFPKLENENNYKVEITFGMEFQVNECSVSAFSFPEMKTEYLIPPGRWPYYVIDGETIEVIEGKSSDSKCTSTKRISKKIFSSKKIFENYSSGFKRHFYIPEKWTVEYRTWKVSSEYKTVN
ncbi:ecotin family protein [Chryseobacterium sp.]|uniref:ecotin family protein n=1 Tax=Chryseobacterium sp. TaxID=1871047 RepID=UPI002898CA13|nr:ecotin family protein [Chryseobacterium sp.]